MASDEPSLGLTPPYRIGQSSTHVYVEAHCADTPANIQPEAACDDTIFALRCPPYYLPLHFPAALKPTLHVHRQGSVVRVDLEKQTADLEFLGLDDLQPTLFVDSTGTSSEEASTSQQRGDDGGEAKELLSNVLDREKLTAVDEGKEERNSKSKGKKKPALTSPLDIDEVTRQASAQRAEHAEDEAFDEQGYLDAYVDEDGYIAELVRTRWSTEGGAPATTLPQASDNQASAPSQLVVAILLDLLLAHHLTLTHIGGPPLSSASSAYLLCSFSRTLSSLSPSPPSNPQEALRCAYRRGLAFAPHASWAVCKRAHQDAVATLRSPDPRQALAKVLRDLDECLAAAVSEEPEGPMEAERCRGLRESLTRERLGVELGRLDEDLLKGLADELQGIEMSKTGVGAKWDMELLEQMADEVIEEEKGQTQGETREQAPKEEQRISDLCDLLEPPHTLAVRLDDPDGLKSAASSTSDEQEQVQRWRNEEAPQLLRRLGRELGLMGVRLGRRRQQRATASASSGPSCVTPTATTSPATQTLGRVLITISRFNDPFTPWSTLSSSTVSRRTLTRLLPTSPASLSHSIDILHSVLSSYIRPLFLSVDGGGPVDENTGRLRAQRVGMEMKAGAGRTTGIEEDVAWKGGQKGSQGSSGNGVLARSKGVAVHLTLQACLEGLQRLQIAWEERRDQRAPATVTHASSSSNGPAPWPTLYHLLLPPLLTLAEDPSPPWRLRGATLIVKYLLSSSHARRLLQAANLVPHLRDVLGSDLTYLSSAGGVGVELLDTALRGLQILAVAGCDEEAQQAVKEELMRLIQEGVLRVWSMAPASLTALDVDVDSPGSTSSDTPLDLLSSTFHHLALLLEDLGHPYVARYGDVVLQVLLGSVNGLELPEGEGAAPTMASRERARQRMVRRRERARHALRASRVLVAGCLKDLASNAEVFDGPHITSTSSSLPLTPPGLSRWLPRALGAHVRAWLALHEDGFDEDEDDDEATKALHDELRQSWSIWQRVPPPFLESSDGTAGERLSVEEMERRVLDGLVEDDGDERGRKEAEEMRRQLFGR